MTKCIMINGAMFHVDDDFDENDAVTVRALAGLADAAREKLADLPDEMVERQDAAMRRIRERNALALRDRSSRR